MPSSYLPQPLPAFRDWFQNFADLITLSPSTYGLTTSDALSIQASYDTFAAAYAISTSPLTRTPTTVQDTITARNTSVQIIRAYGRLILANQGVADADKVALGLHLRDTVNTPIPAPLTNPLLTLVGATPGQITAQYRDSAASPGIKAKPFGAASMQLFVAFGTVAPVTPGATPFQKLVTKSPFFVDTSTATPGQTAFVYARWVTARGLIGPWSPLATMVCV